LTITVPPGHTEAAGTQSSPLPGSWLVMSAELLPDALLARCVELRAVQVDPDEVHALFGRPSPAATLAADQRELVPLVVRGLSQREIADALHVSLRTAQRRLLQLRKRVGAHSHSDLIARLLRSSE
jgi:DNA-binding CsgD family transcriptional regulator